MDYSHFYHELFSPLEATLGSRDPNTIFAIVGFDCGGPLNFVTFGVNSGQKFVTYVSCELAVRREQRPAAFGRYELLASCDDEHWVRHWLSEIGRMSLLESFDDGHTLDFGENVAQSERIHGVLFEKGYSREIGGESYGILRCVGITRDEIEFARQYGSKSLLARLHEWGVYPNTHTKRSSAT
jgi:hypothetical protein